MNPLAVKIGKHRNHPGTHLLSGFIGKSNGHNPVGGNSLIYQVNNTAGENPGLATTGAC